MKWSRRFGPMEIRQELVGCLTACYYCKQIAVVSLGPDVS